MTVSKSRAGSPPRAKARPDALAKAALPSVSPVSAAGASGSLCNGAALRKAARRLTQLYDNILAPCGLRLSQHSILVHIFRAGSPAMGELADDMVLDRSALSHNLKPLERDGFVVQVRDPADKRTRRVELTAAGHQKLAESKALWNKAHARFERAYGAKKAIELRAMLADVYSDRFKEAFEAQD
jgi:DNA-binding MarR family transcriptional regulator